MTGEEANDFLIDISYKLGNMAIEYLTEKDGEKMREAIKVLEQEPCGDVIKRQDVIDALWNEREKMNAFMQECLKTGNTVLRANTKIERNRIEEDIYIIKAIPPVIVSEK